MLRRINLSREFTYGKLSEEKERYTNRKLVEEVLQRLMIQQDYIIRKKILNHVINGDSLLGSTLRRVTTIEQAISLNRETRAYELENTKVRSVN